MKKKNVKSKYSDDYEKSLSEEILDFIKVFFEECI